MPSERSMEVARGALREIRHLSKAEDMHVILAARIDQAVAEATVKADSNARKECAAIIRRNRSKWHTEDCGCLMCKSEDEILATIQEPQ